MLSFDSVWECCVCVRVWSVCKSLSVNVSVSASALLSVFLLPLSLCMGIYVYVCACMCPCVYVSAGICVYQCVPECTFFLITLNG